MVFQILHKQFISNSCDCFLAELEYLWLTLCYKVSAFLVLYRIYAALFGTANDANVTMVHPILSHSAATLQ